MHDTAMDIGGRFLASYLSDQDRIIVEIGALDVNGSIRSFSPADRVYIGLDLEHGKGVDFIIKPGEPLPFRDGFADVIISTSQFEHDPQFWVTFVELMRILRPGGVLYISSPSNGPVHRYPVDVWRFYPDAAQAMADWAKSCGQPTFVVETFTALRTGDVWNDFVAIFVKGNDAGDRNFQFLSNTIPCVNVRRCDAEGLLNEQVFPEDMIIIRRLQSEIDQLQAENKRLSAASEIAANDFVREIADLKAALALAVLPATQPLEPNGAGLESGIVTADR